MLRRWQWPHQCKTRNAECAICHYSAFCILQSAFAWLSERLSKADVQRGPPFETLLWDELAVQLESEIDPDRPDRRFDPQAEADRASEVAKIDVARAGEDVAAVDESHHANRAPH